MTEGSRQALLLLIWVWQEASKEFSFKKVRKLTVLVDRNNASLMDEVKVGALVFLLLFPVQATSLQRGGF